MDRQQLVREIDNKYRLYRSIFNLIQTERFIDVYAKANDTEKSILATMAHQGQLKQIRALMRKIVFGNYDKMSFGELKELAKNLGLSDYSYMTRGELLTQVVEHVSKDSTSA